MIFDGIKNGARIHEAIAGGKNTLAELVSDGTLGTEQELRSALMRMYLRGTIWFREYDRTYHAF